MAQSKPASPGPPAAPPADHHLDPPQSQSRQPRRHLVTCDQMRCGLLCLGVGFSGQIRAHQLRTAPPDKPPGSAGRRGTKVTGLFNSRGTPSQYIRPTGTPQNFIGLPPLASTSTARRCSFWRRGWPALEVSSIWRNPSRVSPAARALQAPQSVRHTISSIRRRGWPKGKSTLPPRDRPGAGKPQIRQKRASAIPRPAAARPPRTGTAACPCAGGW